MKTDRNQRTWIPVIILILTGMLLIGGVSASEFGPWNPQTVDSGGKVGQYSSAALDAVGNPAISYYDQTYGDLMYAIWDGKQWNITTVDCSRSEPKSRWYFWNWGHDRTKDHEYITCFHGTEKVGKYSSLAFDSTGKPSISFYDESRHDLKYASWNGSTWVITTVDGYKDYKGHNWKNWDGDHNRIDDRSTQVGEFSSLAFDSNDKPRISYYDESKGDLKYAVLEGSRWNITTVDGSRDEYGQKRNNWDGDWGRYNDRSRRVGEYSSLALDINDNPRISYYDETNQNLKYAVLEGSRWNITTVDGLKKGEGQNKNHWDGDYHRNYDRSNKVGKYSSLALDINGNPRISYYDESNKDLKYAALDGSLWVITTVDSTKRVGEYTSLKLDANGSPRISYYDESNRDLKFAALNRATSKWVTETVDSSGKVGSFTSLVLDSQGRPGISYYDQSHKDLKYTSGTGQTQPPAPVANFAGSPTSGTAPLTVTFTDSSTNTPISWIWDFGDNSAVNATVQNPVHTYASAGNYTVKLTATNSAGSNLFTQTNYITVTSGVVSPVANFVGSPSSGTAPLTVTFTDRSTNTPTLWSWDFGDNSAVNATVQNPVHTYASAGNYTVKLTATNSAGSNSSTQTNYITVTSGVVSPVANFVGSPSSGTAPLTVTFTESSTNTPTLWSWDFGDNSAVNATMQNPVHNYASAGTYTVKLTATNSAGSNTSTQTNYITVNHPVETHTITSITPASGPINGGTAVTIVGTNFAAGVGVTIGGAAATNVKVVDATHITAFTPPGTSGARDVVITNIDGPAVTATGAFTYVAPPTFTSITPNSGSTLGGTTVTIVGTNFVNGIGVTIGGAAATNVNVVNATHITAFTPPGTIGVARDVVITNQYGQTVTGTGAYTYVIVPTVTSILVDTGTAGTTLTVSITGTNFGTGTTVWFEKGTAIITPTVLTFDSSEKIYCTFTLPAPEDNPYGNWDVVVKNADGQSSRLIGGFIIKPPLTTPAPTVTLISPASGIAGTSATVTLTGTNFVVSSPQTTVWLAKGTDTIIPTVLTVNSPNQITCMFNLPALSSTSAATWDVIVRNPDAQTVIKPAAFEVTNPAPTVTGIDPASGIAGNTVTATITGANFVTGTTPTVWLAKGADKINATAVIVGSSTQITCTFTLPAPGLNPAGQWGVVVMNEDGQQGSMTPAFTVTNYPPPTVTGISPNTGVAGGTPVTVTLTGTRFVTGTTVKLTKTGASDLAATTVTVDSPTQITCTLPLPELSSTSSGDWDVVVSVPNEQPVTMNAAFKVTNPIMTVTNITPPWGYAGTTQNIVITGTNFVTVGEIKPNVWLTRNGESTMTSRGLTVNSLTQISCRFAIPSPTTTNIGLWDVNIRNEGDGQTVIIPNGFEVKLKPTTTPTP